MSGKGICGPIKYNLAGAKVKQSYLTSQVHVLGEYLLLEGKLQLYKHILYCYELNLYYFGEKIMLDLFKMFKH